jgi:hypothetical protein
MIQFQTGKTYYCRSICDYDCVFIFTVVKRTAKFVTLSSDQGTKRVGVSEGYEGGHEVAYPHGKYSMCAVLRADCGEVPV